MPLGTKQLMKMRGKGSCEQFGEGLPIYSTQALKKKAFRIILRSQPKMHVFRPLGLLGPKNYKFGIAVGMSCNPEERIYPRSPNWSVRETPPHLSGRTSPRISSIWFILSFLQPTG